MKLNKNTARAGVNTILMKFMQKKNLLKAAVTGRNLQ